MIKEDGRTLVELLGLFGSEQTESATLTDTVLHVGVSQKVGLQTICNIVALGDYLYARRHELGNLVHKQWIVSAAKDNRINQWILFKHLAYLLFHKIICSWEMSLVVLNEWDPHRASNASDLDVGV